KNWLQGAWVVGAALPVAAVMAAEAVADKEDRGWFKRINLFLFNLINKQVLYGICTHKTSCRILLY
ncbi:MAG: hypothetical protein RBT01_13680, partial [Anaerolineaceae bacterium]|nr:hypothetical protein [Anaerolineaceae bacterium]